VAEALGLDIEVVRQIEASNAQNDEPTEGKWLLKLMPRHWFWHMLENPSPNKGAPKRTLLCF
jgi:hypothetical protein